MALRWGNDVSAGLGDVLPGWQPVWTATSWQTGGLPARGPTTTQRWANKLPYGVKQALVYSINPQPRELRHGSKSQVRPDGVPPPWQCALKRLMGSPAAAPVVVPELWHAIGELYGDDLVHPHRAAPEDLHLGHLYVARGQDEVNHGSLVGVGSCSPPHPFTRWGMPCMVC